MTILVDGDILVYRAAFYAESNAEDTDDLEEVFELASEKIEELMSYIANEIAWDPETASVNVYLTGRSNFRYEIAKRAPYKGNRKSEKPIAFQYCRDYLVEHYAASISEGQEADDDIAIAAATLGYDNVTIASIDKDFLQVPCQIFNFNKGEFARPTEHEGLMYFYEQILSGDRADNIVGLWRVGPKKAQKILKGARDEVDMYNRVLKAYDYEADRVLENARLLWLRREEDQLWLPPELK
jgi:5'-3' exonuclease